MRFFVSIIIHDCVLVTYAERITAQFIKHTAEITESKNHKPVSILFKCSEIHRYKPAAFSVVLPLFD